MKQDRRTVRTRSALIGAFNFLMLHRRQRRIRVADITDLAKVGRSTFYEHYSNADDVMLAALRGPMAAYADAACGRGDLARTTALLAHFWDNRGKAREILGGPLGERVTRLLAEMVAERLEGRTLALPVPLAARQMADAALGPVRAWVFAEAPCTAEVLAEAVVRGGEQLAAVLASEK